MAGEHDFTPLREAELVQIEDCDEVMGGEAASMARELRATRAAMLALVEAEDQGNDSLPAIDAIRALVAHVGAEGVKAIPRGYWTVAAVEAYRRSGEEGRS